ncbi:MAG: hypothetical protein H0T92_18955 [Pyrinomonadaceae bacterium]|nr:hypothetical protein [Pyrinomonadaceae bacterium]
MITGFNTDVEHDGVVYHVQTEDKGLDSPLILSLIYVGGAILASKRSPYDDLITAGFSESALAERLQRQHKLICAAISVGRIQDLRNMSDRDAAQRVNRPSINNDKAKQPQQINLEQIGKAPAHNLDATPQSSLPPSLPPAQSITPSTRITRSASHDPTQASPVEACNDTLHLNILEEKKFRAGEQVTLKISVTREAEGEGKLAIAGASVTVKVLGSTFQPISLSAKTEQNGIAVVHATLPRFASGRAAILIRAVDGGSESELRRIIHQA